MACASVFLERPITGRFGNDAGVISGKALISGNGTSSAGGCPQGGSMDNWKTAAVAAIAIAAFAGIAFAAGGWGGGYTMGNWQNQPNSTFNATGFWHGGVALNDTNWTGGMHTRRMGNNGTGRMGFGRRAGNQTNQSANAAAFSSFNSAVLSGDFATAQQLHNEYGFGGPIYGKLNATTFAQVSQIANLEQQAGNIEKQLRQELGINGTALGMMGGFGPMPGGSGSMPMKGMQISRGRTRNNAYHQTPNAVPG